MDQCNDKLLLRVTELENEIQSIYEPDLLTLSTVREVQQRLFVIARRMNNFHNSKLAINRIALDVLYNIFTLAIYESARPWKTALKVSHVCRHWRKSALGWPPLWEDLNFNASVAILDLFISRSENAPLTFSIDSDRRGLSNFLKSRAVLILPRLRSLTIWYREHRALPVIGRVFQELHPRPLQLQCLDIVLSLRTLYKPELPPFVLNMDVSCLRQLKLREMSLPWLQLPPSNRLTHCTLWYSVDPPTLPQLLVFLSSCPLLFRLDLCIAGSVGVELGDPGPSTVNTLCLPNLKELVLESKGSSESNYEYVHELLALIQIPKSLSQFNLCYYDFIREPSSCGDESDSDSDESSDSEDLGLSLPFSVFESVPPGIISKCAAHRYLYLAVDLYNGFFKIFSRPEYTLDDTDYPLKLVGSCQYDNSQILELIRAMPKTTSLKLSCQAWELIFRNIDMASAFPCLEILELEAPDTHRRWRRSREPAELQWPHWTCPIISSDSLPQVKLKLKTLILPDLHGYGDDSLLTISEVISKTGVEVLKLDSRYYYNAYGAKKIISALRQQGVVVLPIKRNEYW